MPAICIFLLYYLAPAEPRDPDYGSVLGELQLEVVARGVVLDGAHVDPRLRRQHDVRQHLRLLHLVSGGGSRGRRFTDMSNLGQVLRHHKPLIKCRSFMK